MFKTLIFLILMSTTPTMANELACGLNAPLNDLEEFAADARLDLLIDNSCTGVKKSYIKKIFKTRSSKEAEMNFLNQSFCFRKKNGKIVGCHVNQSHRLASVSKIFSMDYLHTYFGDTDLSVSATLSSDGNLCLENDGLANLTNQELNGILRKFQSKKTISNVCVSEKFNYSGDDLCLKEYTNAMHSQSKGVISNLQSCSDQGLKTDLGVEVKRGNCSCDGEKQNYSVKLKDRTQPIMAASDSWQILMLYDKLGSKAKNGLQQYLRNLKPNSSELNLKDPVGNSAENRASCEAVLNAPAIKSCKNPPLACADTEGSTFNHFTKFVGGKTKQKKEHEEYYEKLDDHLCGKTGTIASEGLKNFVGCIKDQPNDPIQSFAIFLDGKDVNMLKEMKAHTEVLEDFYQQLLDPKTQRKLIRHFP